MKRKKDKTQKSPLRATWELFPFQFLDLSPAAVIKAHMDRYREVVFDDFVEQFVGVEDEVGLGRQAKTRLIELHIELRNKEAELWMQFYPELAPVC
jgi:hypothetical protein